MLLRPDLRLARGLTLVGLLGLSSAALVACQHKPGDHAAGGTLEQRLKSAREKMAARGKPGRATTPPPKVDAAAPCYLTYSASYWLGYVDDLDILVPNAANLPPVYQQYYGDTVASLTAFTLQTATRDGFDDAQVCVNKVRDGDGFLQYVVTVGSNKYPAVQSYQTVQPTFFDSWHGGEAFYGAYSCQQCSDCASCTVNGQSLCGYAKGLTSCWQAETPPWWWFLPLGLPMLQQQAVLLLDYPPTTAFQAADYLGNYTMCRWQRLLSSMSSPSVQNPYLYETIVDVRPLAAKGSGMDSYLPNPVTTFNNAAATTPQPGVWGANYITPMLQLLTNPLGALQGSTLPMAVLGSPAQSTWSGMIGAQVAVLSTGSTNLAGQANKTAWVAGNHPDTTAYNCCGQDSTCAWSAGPGNGLVCNEQADFVVQCWLTNQSDPSNFIDCMNRWMPGISGTNPCPTGAQPPTTQPPPNAGDALDQCIQEKLDNGNPAAVCCTFQDAHDYCQAYDNNACATLDCAIPADRRSKITPAKARASADTCNGMRFFNDDPKDAPYCTRCGGCSGSTAKGARAKR